MRQSRRSPSSRNQSYLPFLIKKNGNHGALNSIFSHDICSGIKREQVKKTICHSELKTFDFFQNSPATFHRVTFSHSLSCVLLIDKPNESC